MVVVLLSGMIPLHTALSQYDQKHETVQAKKNGEFYHNSIVCLLSQTTSEKQNLPEITNENNFQNI